jgi:arylsulfatase A-like enzyme
LLVALRRGKWKILHVAPAAGGRPDGKWQLYDMSVDPGEVNDLSEEHPDLLKDLLRQWELYVEQTGTVWGEDKLPIGAKGTGWNGTDENIIGGE